MDRQDALRPEYRVINTGNITPAALEQKLNELAEEGFAFVGTAGNFIVMEKQR